MTDVSLVVMPFGSVHRPAIGVSLLKAGLAKIGISATVHYFNLKLAEQIGLDLHDRLSETSQDSPLIGELIFASFAFQTREWKKQNIRNMLNQILDTRHYGYSLSSVDRIFHDIILVQQMVPEFLNDCAYNLLKEGPKLVGFTSTFEQNCPSLALARTLKEEAPSIPIIFGGANCEGEMASSLLKCASWVDFVCSGDGDIAFVEFVKSFLKDNNPYHKINGIITRDSSPFEIAMSSPVMNMDNIPFPDFDDYFAALRCSNLGEEIDSELVIETSRGCWWGEKFQCTFCGLNGSAMKYRSKSVSRVLDEIKYLTNRYNKRKLQVVDNILDLKYIDELFPQIYNERLDVKLFYDTKANLSKKQLMVMARGGIVGIQPGIENLSDSVLKIMKKGVIAFQNIQLLKWCREIGIIPLWNLIWGFPTEPTEEYDRMARLIPLLVHLHPPSGIGPITLDRYSPYFVESLQNGMVNVRPWMTYKFLYPLDGDDLFKMAYHFDFDYSDGRNPASYTKELERQIQNWKELWISDNEGTVFPPVLIMVCTKDLIMISDTRPCSIQRFHTLADEEAKIYGLCETMHTFDSIYTSIKEDFPLFKEEDLGNVLSDLIDKKLMVCDNSRYLSLAIPATPV